MLEKKLVMNKKEVGLDNKVKRVNGKGKAVSIQKVVSYTIIG